MTALSGEDYYESQARDFAACYAALDYMGERGTDHINLDDLDDRDLVEADQKVTWGLLFDTPDITRDLVEEYLSDYLARDTESWTDEQVDACF